MAVKNIRSFLIEFQTCLAFVSDPQDFSGKIRKTYFRKWWDICVLFYERLILFLDFKSGRKGKERQNVSDIIDHFNHIFLFVFLFVFYHQLWVMAFICKSTISTKKTKQIIYIYIYIYICVCVCVCVYLFTVIHRLFRCIMTLWWGLDTWDAPSRDRNPSGWWICISQLINDNVFFKLDQWNLANQKWYQKR